MKIYVVTKGSYSDYRILTATLDKSVAQKIRTKFNMSGYSWDEARIEEYDDAELWLSHAYFIRFDKNGDVIELEDESHNDMRYDDNHACHFDRGGNVFITVLADSEEEAVKIANEKRAQFLAQKAGIA